MAEQLDRRALARALDKLDVAQLQTGFGGQACAKSKGHLVSLTEEEHHALWLARHPPPLLEPYDPWESPIPEGRTLITLRLRGAVHDRQRRPRSHRRGADRGRPRRGVPEVTAAELMALLADVPPETVVKINYEQFAEADVDAECTGRSERDPGVFWLVTVE